MYLMVDNYDSFVHNLATYMHELGCQVELVRNDGFDPAALADLISGGGIEGLVISPGPKDPTDCGLSMEAVRLAAGRVPVLGVCLGHQVIASVFGASVGKGPRPMHGKVTRIVNDGTGLFRGLPQSYLVTRYHSLVVKSGEGFPRELRVDAWSEDGEIMAISHREMPVYGVQFHPEAVLTEHGHELLKGFARICVEWGDGIWRTEEPTQDWKARAMASADCRTDAMARKMAV